MNKKILKKIQSNQNITQNKPTNNSIFSNQKTNNQKQTSNKKINSKFKLPFFNKNKNAILKPKNTPNNDKQQSNNKTSFKDKFTKKNKPNTSQQIKETEIKKPINKKKILIQRILIGAAGLMYIVFIAGIIFIFSLLSDKPELNFNDFLSQESSTIYDRNGEVISELGLTIRKNVTYEDLPTSLVDAFVAIEDSRFFEHNGFDLPRFTRAFLENIKSMSFGQGGSTFTMQLIKNTYFVDDAAGVGASKSIKRKVQEIALAIELENNPNVSKKDIFTAYLNKLYFGGTYQNIRGIQKAAEYYFGKEVNELTLPESAMLAGVVNAPNLYNPYNNMKYAQERRDEVLYLMNYHGYITDEEYDIAVKTKVEDLLYDTTRSKKAEGKGTPYQAYIDEVVDEVYELTGLDPYTTTMKIYTAMDKNIQEKMDEIQAEKVDDKYYRTASDGSKYFYPDDKWEVASICVDNVTGEIYGILGGRSYANGGALLLNHATQQRKQPGSSIKPILDYAQAFEVLGWSTSHYITDKPVTYPGTGILIGNSNGTYQGDIPLKHAVYESLNTTAITTLQEIINDENGGNAYLSNYLNTIGYDVDPTEFNVQYAIGGSSLEVTPLQMAGAQAMLINQGKYNKPHTITKIEFLNDKQPIIYETQTVQALSPEAAYLTTELLKFNVSGNVTRDDGSHYANLMELFQDNYQVYAKTGTTNWDSSAKVYGIPNGSIKDGWTIASTSKVTVATWMGYEKAEKTEDGTVYGYIPYSIYNQNIKGKITKMILTKSVESFGQPEAVQRPDGVQSITHITIPGKPYVSPVEGMDEKYVTTGLIKKSAYSTVSPQDYNIAQMEGNIDASIANNVVFFSMPSYPNTNSDGSSDGTYDISLYNSNGDLMFFSSPIYGKKSFDYSWLFGNVKYKVDIQVDGNTLSTSSYDTNSGSISLGNYLTNGSLKDGDEIKVCAYYGYDENNMRSNTICSSPLKISDKITFFIDGTWLFDEIKDYFINTLGIPENKIKFVEKGSTDGIDGTVESIELANKEKEKIKRNTSYTLSRNELYNVTITYIKLKAQPKATLEFLPEENPKTIKPNIENYKGKVIWKIYSSDILVNPNDDPIEYNEQYMIPDGLEPGKYKVYLYTYVEGTGEGTPLASGVEFEISND